MGRSAAHYPAGVRRRPDPDVELSELFTRRAADCVSAERVQPAMDPADLDLAHGRRQPTALLPRAHEAIQGAPTWSPDGQWIAYAEWKEQHWELVKVRVGSGEGPVVLRKDGVPNATPHWSPKNEWITWETEQGFVLVSPDGKEQRAIPAGPVARSHVVAGWVAGPGDYGDRRPAPFTRGARRANGTDASARRSRPFAARQ